MIGSLIRMISVVAFVLSTMVAPMHAMAMPMPNTTEVRVEAGHDMAAMPGEMSADCAKAMGVTNPNAGTGNIDNAKKTGGDCCHDGCYCPLSHCPGIVYSVVPSVTVAFYGGPSVRPVPPSLSLPNFLSDALERPPRI